jgi:hypothetical protein
MYMNEILNVYRPQNRFQKGLGPEVETQTQLGQATTASPHASASHTSALPHRDHAPPASPSPLPLFYSPHSHIPSPENLIRSALGEGTGGARGGGGDEGTVDFTDGGGSATDMQVDEDITHMQVDEDTDHDAHASSPPPDYYE